jgi:hypothetical protein
MRFIHYSKSKRFRIIKHVYVERLIRLHFSLLSVPLNSSINQLDKSSEFVTNMENDLEYRVGIQSFANSSSGFQGVHKQRFSDFIVREVRYLICSSPN